MNVLYVVGRYATENMDTSEESKIVFPGELLSNTVVKFLPQVRGQQPICADEYGICENADNYPQLVVILTVVPLYTIFTKVSGFGRHDLIYISVPRVQFTPCVQ
jgi:hypothetical protein